jgi:2-polyprenyl-3-methyl-5-hydroxy-6-metoxy-1,4-benzoquinol methylase
MASQVVFQSVYRGRQRAWHHLAYMRMAKVLLALHVLERAGINLAGKAIFDYGFGAGTFFRYCPVSARLAGVEMDPVNVAAVREGLRARGFPSVRLDAITIEGWEKHPLLQEQYDIFLCSHVLEHLPDPAAFLRRIRRCLKPDGWFVGLAPLNERRDNPHHVQVCERAKIEGWLAAGGLIPCAYLESDPWFYWIQPLYTCDTGPSHRLAQVLSLGLGVLSTLLGHRAWEALAPWCARLTGAKPTQAAFVARRCD